MDDPNIDPTAWAGDDEPADLRGYRWLVGLIAASAALIGLAAWWVL